MENKTSKQPADDLEIWCKKAREAVLQAASMLQYDSAVYTGRQLGVPLRPEPFSARQQKQCKWDGAEEEADDNKAKRKQLDVTMEELNGHLKKEHDAHIAQQRPMRHPGVGR